MKQLHNLPRVLFVLFFLLGQSYAVYSNEVDNQTITRASLQQRNISLKLTNATLSEILAEVRKQTNLNFVYKETELQSFGKKSISVTNVSVETALNKLFSNTAFSYKIENNSISIFKKTATISTKPVTVKGKIVNNSTKKPIVGATIIVLGTNNGAISDDNGSYSFSAKVGEEIEVSFVGMKTLKTTIGNNYSDFVIHMEDDALAVEDVVVTGIYTRKSESFTGSSATFKTQDLKRVGGQNVLQSLKTLDPSFNIMESREFGSDPNRLPDIEIRGKSSVIGLKEQFETDPNQPLFILDGFETTLKTVVDLNMDRVASVTILKDAASTAIYGSKAANGVVVIETKAPEKGKFRVSYSGNMFLSMPDLSDYNLMNSKEKLQFELEAGRYEANNSVDRLFQDSLYNANRAEVTRGVDTYWLSEPLRTAITHKHNIYAEGGDDAVRYGLGVTYNATDGVMKKSGNDLFGANFDLIYRKGKFLMSNKMSIDYYTQNDPTVTFSDYAKANPYYRKTDENGEINRYLADYYSINKERYSVSNPMYNDNLNSFDESSKLDFVNRLNMEFKVLPNLVLRGRLSLGKSTTQKDIFTSPSDPRYDNVKYDKKGSYRKGMGDDFNYDGDVTLSYAAVLKKHQISAVIGSNIRSNRSKYDENTSIGFPIGSFDRPSFASGYGEGSKPNYSDVISRSHSVYLNGGYVFDYRYLLDVNFRYDGASIFGSNKKYTETWSVGLAWNIHKEAFMENITWMNLLKVRASVGNPGNQNFNAYQSYQTYVFYNDMQNAFGNGMLIDGFGNPDLKWQKTLDQNIGFDLAFMNNRLGANFDYYIKDTDPLLAEISVPSSVGVKRIYTNMGAQKTKGFSGTIKFAPIYRIEEDINWTLSASVRHQKAEYRNLGNSLDQYNKENMENSFVRFYDGGSPTSLWAVQSLGINPADGREVFLKKDGTHSVDYDINDQIIVGNSEPKLEGVLGSVLYYKGFTFSVYFRYSLGADVFNKAVYEKVENMSVDQLKYNQDKRALYERWRSPGDNAKYKGISLTDVTPMSSRFVLRENYIKAESVSVGYDFELESIKKLGLQSLRLQANASDLFRISTVKEERGTEYPFARQFSLSLSVMF